MPDRDELEAEVIAVLKRFITALDGGTRDDLDAFCRLPVARVGVDAVGHCAHFPLDPAQRREATGASRSNVMIDVVHVAPHKAHVLVDGNRCAADGTVVDSIADLYVLQRLAGEWKIVLVSSLGDGAGQP